MKVSKSHIILTLLGVVFIGGFLFFLNLSDDDNNIIGGQRDENGCLGPAGYTFVERIGACARDWEIDTEDKRQAAKIAVEHVGFKKGLTVIDIEIFKCPGCFDINLDRDEERISVSLRDWKVSSVDELDLELEKNKEEGPPASIKDNFDAKAVY